MFTTKFQLLTKSRMFTDDGLIRLSVINGFQIKHGLMKIEVGMGDGNQFCPKASRFYKWNVDGKRQGGDKQGLARINLTISPR